MVNPKDLAGNVGEEEEETEPQTQCYHSAYVPATLPIIYQNDARLPPIKISKNPYPDDPLWHRWMCTLFTHLQPWRQNVTIYKVINVHIGKNLINIVPQPPRPPNLARENKENTYRFSSDTNKPPTLPYL